MLIEIQAELGIESVPLREGLFLVWIDLDAGTRPSPDWWVNSEPRKFAEAMIEAAECWATDWIAIVLPAEVNPRPDGRWDNP